MFKCINKFIYCLLLLEVPYMNLALKAMNEDTNKIEKNSVPKKNNNVSINKEQIKSKDTKEAIYNMAPFPKDANKSIPLDFLALPQDCVRQTLSYLSKRDQDHFRLVCKKFLGILDNTVVSITLKNMFNNSGISALFSQTSYTFVFAGSPTLEVESFINRLPNLRRLELTNNTRFVNDLLPIFAKNISLTALHLNNNKIGAEGVKVLSTGNLHNLIALNLNRNSIGGAGAKALSSGNLFNLIALSLYNNNIGAEGAKGLSEGNLINLESLSLEGNSIGVEGTKSLSSGSLLNLKTLHLQHNDIGNEGAKTLSSGNLLNLKTLHLQHNNIGMEGTKALSSGNLHNLTVLNLGYNNIGEEGGQRSQQWQSH